MTRLKYLGGYPPDLLARVEQLIEQGQPIELPEGALGPCPMPRDDFDLLLTWAHAQVNADFTMKLIG